MHRIFVIAIMIGIVVVAPVASAWAVPIEPPVGFVNTLMPRPAHLSAHEGRFVLTPSFTIIADHYHDARLDAGITRALNHLRIRSGISFAPSSAAANVDGTLTVSVERGGEAIQAVDEDESYSLDVNSSRAQLHAATVVGALHGLETLQQLVQSDATGYFLTDISIQDSPRFRWRGLMVDCGRHFIPVDVLLRTLDAMAAVKLNVFHWHLSEDQGFRLESHVFRKLTSMGSDGLFYTQEQAREVVAYARDRGIRVVPEFDMPGHTSAWFVGYPDLASASGPFHIEREFGVFDPVMDPTRESTYKFLDTFVGEIATIFPDHYLHIGGDENNGVEWKANERIQAFMHEHNLKDVAALQNYFNQRLLKILEKHGKHIIGWDEILTPDLPKGNNIVVQSWRGFDSLATAAKARYNSILSAGYYLNLMSTAADHYDVDPLPEANDLSPEQQAHILGGEACIWTEQTTPQNFDSRVWPRTAAIAERLWSPRDVDDVDDMYRRLAVESLRLENLNLTHISQEDVSLRQLTGSDKIDALHTLAFVLEPVTFDDREHMQHPNQLTPLSQLVDALPPDPPSRHNFELLVHTYLQNPASQQQAGSELTTDFKAWIATEPEILHSMANSPALAQVESRAAQLASLGAVGMEAISYLSSGLPAPAGWKAAKMATLNAAEKPQAFVRFTVIKPLRDLVNAVPETSSK